MGRSVGRGRLVIALAGASLTAALLGATGGCQGTPVGPAASPATAGSSSSAAPSARPGEPAKRAPFVVAIVVDQLSAWVAASRLPELPKDGGFARLMREGTRLEALRYPYAVTDTAPGHTSLHTGKLPAESGIFGNEVPDEAGLRHTILRDDKVRPVLSDGPHPGEGSSAARLRVDTVADRLRAARPDALIVSVSVKDRGAILPAGKHPSHVLWFEAAHDSFVTSTAFSDTYPSWAVGVGDAKAVAAARAKPWELTDASWVKSHSVTPDNQAGEGDLDGMGTTFPHVAKTAAAFRATPASDAMIARLGLAAIEAEYDPAKPTLLLLSFSASDIIGHLFGPDSWEAWDQLRKLDATLASLFDALEKRHGGPVSILLAADHGNISLPEIPPARAGVSCPPAPPDPLERPCTPGTRMGTTSTRDELVAAAKAALGAGRWIAGFADNYAYLTPAARSLPADRRALLDVAVRTTLAKHSSISEVLDVRVLATQCPKALASARGVPDRARLGESVLTLVCRSWAEHLGAGDYFVVPGPGSFFDSEIVLGKGTSHGTPYAYDRTVSMLARGPGIEAGAVIADPVDFSFYAALEAALVGLDGRAPRDILAAHRAGRSP
jgi:predicted AlkP superfamily pyrophosphatase or phosphodiesterase